MADTKFKRGHPKKGGKKRGTPNKFTNIKQSFVDAFKDKRVGGTEGLVKWVNESKRNRAMFYQLITKLFPTAITGGDKEDSEPLRITFVRARKEEEVKEKK